MERLVDTLNDDYWSCLPLRGHKIDVDFYQDKCIMLLNLFYELKQCCGLV